MANRHTSLLAFFFISASLHSETVAIDPGHGGSSPSGTIQDFTLSSPNNASTPSGLKEKDLALQLSRAIKLALQEKGIRCILTRYSDVNPDFQQRAESIAAQKTDFIVSIHFNASNDHKAIGTLTMVGSQKRNPNFAHDMQFATGLTLAVSKAVAQFVPDSKARATIEDSHLHSGLGSNFFKQLSKHQSLDAVPKCFLEVEFIDNEITEKTLIACREKSFPAIAKAFADYIFTQAKN